MLTSSDTQGVTGQTVNYFCPILKGAGFPASEGVVAGAVVSAKAEPGIYLVICNVRGHFLDGMFAFVEVKAEDEDN